MFASSRYSAFSRRYLPLAVALLFWGVMVVGDSSRAWAQQRTFTFVNQCNETIWVGSLGNPGKGAPNNGGWELRAGQSSSVTTAGDWAGRFWGRRGCRWEGSQLVCDTGDCGGRAQCAGAGGRPPTSLAEFTLAGWGNLDYYDVSLVDGYDLPIKIQPVPANTNPNNVYQCGAPTCNRDLLSICPPELQQRNAAGQVVACRSACDAFNTDYYCCRGAHNTPETCDSSDWPVNYPAIFKSACPLQYSYAYDDVSSTFTCNNPYPNYTITFCAIGGSPPPPPPPPPAIDPNAFYTLTNVNSGSCIDDAEWGTSNGAKVQQWACGPNQNNQQWKFTPTSNGYYRISSRHAPALVIDVSGGEGSVGDGALLLLWSWWGGTNQQWRPEARPDGSYRFVARNSGKCLDVPWASRDNGVQLAQVTCNGNTAQDFRLTRQ
jgi:hypothetical protein